MASDLTGHDGCRIEEFRRWTRVMLEHERAYLSDTMALGAGFMRAEERAAIMRDLVDIDACLAALDEPLRIAVPQ